MRITTTINNKIKETLESISSIKAVYGYPEEKLTTYPTVVFLEDEFDNDFETTNQNFRVLKYKLWLVVHGSRKELKDIYEKVLPNAKDDIISKFDTDWNGGTIDSNIVWLVVNNGKTSILNLQNGIEVTAELNLLVKLVVNN